MIDPSRSTGRGSVCLRILGLVPGSADPNLAPFHEGLEVGESPRKEDSIGIRDERRLDLRGQVEVDRLPEGRQLEELTPEDADPGPLLRSLEHDHAVVVPSRFVFALHGPPGDAVTVLFILDALELCDVDDLALVEHEVVGLREDRGSARPDA